MNFRKQQRRNETHESKSDPHARLARKGGGQEEKLSYQGNVLMKNRHGLVADAEVAIVTGTSEVDTALVMMDRLPAMEKRRTVGADKLYDQEHFVEEARARNVTPHVAQNTTNRRSAIDARTTSHPGYAEPAASQAGRARLRWDKTKMVGLIRKLRHRGWERVRWMFVFAVGGYDMVRIRTVERAGVCA